MQREEQCGREGTLEDREREREVLRFCVRVADADDGTALTC